MERGGQRDAGERSTRVRGSAGVFLAEPSGPRVLAAAVFEPADADQQQQKRQRRSTRRMGFRWAK